MNGPYDHRGPYTPTLNRDAIAAAIKREFNNHPDGLCFMTALHGDVLGAGEVAGLAADAVMALVRPENEVRAEALTEMADHLYENGYAGSSAVRAIYSRAKQLRSGGAS